jgi:hypothetical protein
VIVVNIDDGRGIVVLTIKNKGNNKDIVPTTKPITVIAGD